MGQKKARSSPESSVDPASEAIAGPMTGIGPPGETDEMLVRSALGGDRSAFDTLVKRYQNAAVSVSYRLLGNRADAVEIVQDAFLKAYRSLDSLERPGAFGGWLMRIVSNLSLNRRRGRHLRRGA